MSKEYAVKYCGYDENGKYFEFEIPISEYAQWYDEHKHLIPNYPCGD